MPLRIAYFCKIELHVERRIKAQDGANNSGYFSRICDLDEVGMYSLESHK
jgi:hypothetical protein